MPARFVDVIVEAHAELPDGCAVRFQVAGDTGPVAAVRYQPGVGALGVFEVEARTTGGAPAPAQATRVHVPGGPARVLISGGAWGLRLTRAGGDSAPAIAEPYLLLDDADVVR